MLGLLVAAFAYGKVGLAEAEELSEDLGAHASPARQGESPAFGGLWQRVVEHFGEHFHSR